MSEKPRLWGIDVIGAVYALAAVLLLFALTTAANTIARAGIGAMLLLAIVLTIGMIARIEWLRLLLTVLLTIAIVADALLGVFYAAVVFEIVSAPASLDSLNKLIRLPIRICLTVSMLLYLRRCDVKEAFSGVDLNAHHEACDDLNT